MISSDFIQRDDVIKTQTDAPNRKTMPYFSKYEYTALIGVRAQQLADGGIPLVNIQEFNKDDPRLLWKIAERELLERKLPFIVRRRLPGGESEYWGIHELELAW
jgi:DNA-directed RNA polymerase I, II, and III subunit RPABC2